MFGSYILVKINLTKHGLKLKDFDFQYHHLSSLELSYN